MNKIPYIKCRDSHYFLLQDYQDFSGWVVLIVTKNEVFTKADKRIKGSIESATAKFKEIYSFEMEFSYKSVKEVLDEFPK
jgi:hypothetical protein